MSTLRFAKFIGAIENASIFYISNTIDKRDGSLYIHIIEFHLFGTCKLEGYRYANASEIYNDIKENELYRIDGCIRLNLSSKIPEIFASSSRYVDHTKRTRNLANFRLMTTKMKRTLPLVLNRLAKYFTFIGYAQHHLPDLQMELIREAFEDDYKIEKIQGTIPRPNYELEIIRGCTLPRAKEIYSSHGICIGSCPFDPYIHRYRLSKWYYGKDNYQLEIDKEEETRLGPRIWVHCRSYGDLDNLHIDNWLLDLSMIAHVYEFELVLEELKIITGLSSVICTIVANLIVDNRPFGRVLEQAINDGKIKMVTS